MISWVERPPVRSWERKPGELAFERWDAPDQPIEMDDWENEMLAWQGGLRRLRLRLDQRAEASRPRP